MSVDILNYLPFMSRLKERLKQVEAQLQKEFGEPITLTAQRLGNDHAIDAIMKIVSDVMDQPANRILAPTKVSMAASDARKVAMYLCDWFIEDLDTNELAAFFGRNTQTVVNAIDKVNDLLSISDPVITDAVKRCTSIIKSRINSPDYEPCHVRKDK